MKLKFADIEANRGGSNEQPVEASQRHGVIKERITDERRCPRRNMPGATRHGMASGLHRYRCNHCRRRRCAKDVNGHPPADHGDEHGIGVRRRQFVLPSGQTAAQTANSGPKSRNRRSNPQNCKNRLGRPPKPTGTSHRKTRKRFYTAWVINRR